MSAAATQPRQSPDPDAIRVQLESFLAACRDPVIVEPGEAPLSLKPEKHAVEVRGSGCVLEVWNDGGNLVRRLTRCETSKSGLTLWARRFGGEELRLDVYDQARRSQAVARRAERAAFARTLRRMVERWFPLWKVSAMTSAADLERSLSPLYSRGRMTQGSAEWAVIGAAEDLSAVATDGLLTYGLIWLDQVRTTERRRICAGLRLIVPRGREAVIAARMMWLRSDALQFELWTYDRRGEMRQVDPRFAENLSASVPVCFPPPNPAGENAARLAEMLARVDVEAIPLAEGAISIRVRGIEVAQVGRAVMAYGVDGRQAVTAANFADVLRLIDHVGRFRRPDAESVTNPLYSREPERWLESQVRKNPAAIDPSLEPAPIYSGVPALSGRERGVMDLLARDLSGRLVVMELKVEEDIHAPLQALDYWLRVKLAQQRGDFARQGYFRGLPLADAAPRLMLVAPALKFHPTTEIVLRYLDPEARPERVGLSADWRSRLRAAFRLSGAQRAD